MHKGYAFILKLNVLKYLYEEMQLYIKSERYVAPKMFFFSHLWAELWVVIKYGPL